VITGVIMWNTSRHRGLGAVSTRPCPTGGTMLRTTLAPWPAQRRVAGTVAQPLLLQVRE
jgi:hypothetical protein